jgi:amino acid adenylation domain-containing protein/non-ribosomal peptide synthase protein (TIGR01720 family)
MSFAQERLWFMDQMEPGSPFYNLPVAVLLSARLDVPTLERALEEIVRRHEAIRTVFRLIDGKPMQVILPPHTMPIKMIDLRGPNGEEAEEDVIRRATSEDGALPFDLQNGPLFRATLFRVSDADYALLLNMHHIVTDGWSMPIVTREMELLYEAYIEGLDSPLADLEIQYTDYATWQREFLTGATLQKQVDYWKQHLGGAPVLDLPLDRPRPGVQTFNGGIYRFVWPGELAEKLKAFGRQEGASLNMVVMAGYNVMLQKYSGQDDIVVGTLVGNRNHAEIEPLVGYFVNSAAIRTRMDDDPTFRQALLRVRTAILDADANQDLPFERLVDELSVERDLSRNPVFQVMYFHHTFVKTTHHIENSAMQSRLNIRSLFAETGVSLVDTKKSKFDQTLATLEMAGGMPSMVEYNADIWDQDTIAGMMEHLRILLDRFADTPDVPISQVDMLSEDERRQILHAWNDTARPYDTSVPVHARFEAEAAAHPDAPAVESAEGSLTYGELNARANRLARRLRSLGAGRETRIAICAERSPEMLVAMLGVLKAGAAYVPIDPAYPAERIAFMLEDAGVPVLLTQERLSAHLPAFAGTTLRIDADWADVASESAENLTDGASAGDLAYVIYTSGSTGQPKGVQVEHRSLANLAAWHAEAFGVTAADRATMVAGTGFDASGWEVWPYLAAGASLHPVDDDVRGAPRDLVRSLADRRITISFLPTPLAEAALAEEWPAETTLRTLLTGGDRLRSHPKPGLPFTLVNAYGPTESTVVATSGVVEPREGATAAPSIGRPIANTQVYVLDRGMRPVPAGVPGELYVGGAGLARGYLNRPDLTSAAFVKHPFSDEPGARLYRTGDRVRWQANGEIEFLDRVDQQVKVRGHRIELGEVESALARHPGVRDAVVDARGHGAGERRLVGYVVPSGDEAPSAAELRGFLKQSLPEYMVPSAFVTLAALPVTANGKLDRAALPAPEGGRDGMAEEFAMPVGAVEETLARIWGEVLGAESVGANDNFFELGGDSILSIQVIAKAAAEGLRITPKQMFQFQTVAELAPVAGTAAAVEAEQGAVAGPVPLTPVQRWFLEQNVAEQHHFNLSFLFEAREEVDPALLEAAVAAVVAHHDALRLRYRLGEGGWEQFGVDADQAAPFTVVDLSDVVGDEQDAAVAARGAEIQGSLDLEHGPAIRFVLFRFGGDRAPRMLVVAHHLVIDAVSWGIVLADLERAYSQLAEGRAVELPRKTTSFRQWAAHLVEHARSPEMRAEAAFWAEQGRGPGHALPLDHAGGRNTEGTSQRMWVGLDEEETRALLQDVPSVYSTQVNDVLLAALAMAFRGWTGEGDLLVDLEGHGREDLFETVDLSRTAGWFTTVYPVHLSLPADGDLGVALKGVKEQLRHVPHKGIGYGILRYLSDDPAIVEPLRALPTPEVSFNYLGQFEGGASPDAASLFTGVPGDVGPARSPAGERPHLIAVDALVAGGRLQATWTYGTELHDEDTIRRLAEGFAEALRAIVAHCRDPHSGGFTPSDFPDAGIDQDTLDLLMAQLGGGD